MNKSQSKYFNTATKMDLALINLLKKKPFEYITVSEVCKEAHVNRSTFYLHYETLADLLAETTGYILNEFLSYFLKNGNIPTVDIKNSKLEELIFICDKFLAPYLSFIKDNKSIFSTALLNYKALGFIDTYKRLFENIFNPILERFDYPSEYRQYVMMYYLNGITAITLEWLKEDCKMPIEEVSKIITICIYGKNQI